MNQSAHRFERNSHQGFTLLELLTAVAVLAIVLGLAVPSFKDSIRNGQLITKTNALVASINLARSEAIRRGMPVSICAGSNSICSASTDWSTGWIVFSDTFAGTNGTIQTGSGDLVLEDTTLPANGVAVTGSAAFLTFQPTEVLTQTTFTVAKNGCPKDKFTRTLTVELNSRIGLVKLPCT